MASVDEIRRLRRAREQDLTGRVRGIYTEAYAGYRERVERLFYRASEEGRPTDADPRPDRVWDPLRALRVRNELVRAFEEEVIEPTETAVVELLDDELASDYETGLDQALWLLYEQGVDIEEVPDPEDEEEVAAVLAAAAFEGLSYDDRMAAWSRAYDEKATYWINASSAGMTLAATLFGLDAIVNQLAHRAEGLAGNELARATTLGGEWAAEAVAAMVTGSVWWTRQDALVCAICLPLHGQVTPLHPIDDSHPGCLLGDVQLANAQVSAVTQRLYEGRIVIIQTAGGNKLSVTPNHPILTRAGWKAAGLLHKGDEIVCCDAQERVRLTVDNYDSDMPTVIAEVREAFLRASGVTTIEVKQTAEDFHNDGSNGQIAEVSAHSNLWKHTHSAVFQHLLQKNLGWRREFQLTLACLHHSAAFSIGMNSSSRGNMSGSHLVRSLFSGHALPFQAFLLRGRTQYTAAPQVIRHGETVHLEALRQLQDRYPGSVRFDHVIAVKNDFFIGHVYNAETVAGYYTGNGVVVKNCRCVKVPLAALTNERLIGYDQFQADVLNR